MTTMLRKATTAGTLLALTTLFATGLGQVPAEATQGARLATRPSWTSIQPGSSHTCGIRVDASLWCWGLNQTGQVGDGTRVFNRVLPQHVGTEHWSSVAPGRFSTCGIQTDQSMWCWGAGGRLGDGHVRTHYAPVAVRGGAHWSQVSVGDDAACGIRVDQSLWCWGRNANGAVGDGTTVDRLVPRHIGSARWVQVDSSYRLEGGRVCGLQVDHSLWCWGGDILSPEREGSGLWISVGLGYYHACGIKADHSLWCWGDNEYGQLGVGTRVSHDNPVRVGHLRWSSVHPNAWTTCAVRMDQSLWCWGNNGSSQVGDGTSVDRLSPRRVGVESHWQVSGGTGGFHSCGVHLDHTGWCWGENTYGELGTGSHAWRASPTRVL